AGNDFLSGGEGDDLLVGGAGNDELDGGEGVDILAGGFGNDVYFGRAGDTIQDDSGTNTLVLDGSITTENLEVTQFYGEDGISYLELKASGETEGVSILEGEFGHVSSYQFADGTTLTHGELVEGYAGDLFIESQGFFSAPLQGGRGNDVILAGDSGDSLHGGSGNDGLIGGQGEDDLYGGEGDDALDGGAHYDRLEGGNGRDRYLVTWGMGHDTIYESDDGSESVLRLDEGVGFSSLTAERQGDDLTVRFRRSGEGVTIANYYAEDGDWLIETSQGEVQALDDFIANAQPDDVDDVAAAKDLYRDTLAATYRAHILHDGYRLGADGAYHRNETSTVHSSNDTTTTHTHTRNTYSTSQRASDDSFIVTSTQWNNALIESTSTTTQVAQARTGGGSSGQRYSRDIRPTYSHANSRLGSLGYSTGSPSSASPQFYPTGSGNFGVSMPAGSTLMVVGGGFNPYSGSSGYSSASNSFMPAGVWIYPPGYFGGSQAPAPIAERRWGVNSGGTPAAVFRTLTTRRMEYLETFVAEEVTAGTGNNSIEATGYALVDAGAGHDFIEAFDDDFYYDLRTADDAQIGGFYAGNTGEDLILGSGRDDVIAGGEDADYMDGREGHDTYLVDPSESGEDVVHDTGVDFYHSEIPPVLYTDTLRFFSGVELEDLAFSWSEQAADSGLGWMQAYQALTLRWGPDRAVHIVVPPVEDQYIDHWSDDEPLPSGRGIEVVSFDSGQTVSLGSLMDLAPDAPTFDVAELDNVLHGSAREDLISGRGGHDVLFGADGSDGLQGDGGADIVFGGAGDDALATIDYEYEYWTPDGEVEMESSGDPWHDYLDGGEGNDEMMVQGGAAFVAGGAGFDTVNIQDGDAIVGWNAGDGDEAIYIDWGRLTISLGEGIEASDLSLSGGEGTSLYLHIGDETISIQGWESAELYLQRFNEGESAVFDLRWLLDEFDPETQTFSDVLADYVVAERAGPAAVGGLLAANYAANGTFAALSFGQVHELLDGYGFGAVAYYGTMGDDALLGSEDDDYLQAHDGDDVLAGGAGYDTMEGGAGSDLYQYAIGDDWDMVRDTGTHGVDAIVFGEGITLEMLHWDFGYDELVIGEDGGLVIEGTTGLDLSRSAIEEVRFADGTVVSWTALAQSFTDIFGTEDDDELFGSDGAERIFALDGNDYVEAGDGNDMLVGGSGDDELRGGAGDDTYVFEAGDGEDVIADFEGGST
ncbi:MAG TPA: hypothetical protein VEB41_01575, partial [Burkholderiales bacterium]|nr:hypothetical protein [Burkholderiales bacterium]